MVSLRRDHTAPLKVWFDPDINSEMALERARAACILGETVDISRTGIGFTVPSIRVKEKYLVGHDRILNVEIDLPTGKVYMRAKGCRYKKVGVHISAERFLVGANIVYLDGQDKENYEAFLRFGTRRLDPAARSLEIRAK
ncbi:MAG: hypothetical protein IPM59_06350 [Chloracidobacterium sp.]|nr:hypothetical protein [Chloracidobacterium sp.]